MRGLYYQNREYNPAVKVGGNLGGVAFLAQLFGRKLFDGAVKAAPKALGALASGALSGLAARAVSGRAKPAPAPPVEVPKELTPTQATNVDRLRRDLEQVSENITPALSKGADPAVSPLATNAPWLGAGLSKKNKAELKKLVKGSGLMRY